jgi:hypothetical protein
VPKKVARETEDKLFQLYTEDQEIKRRICKKIREDKETKQREYIWAKKTIQQAAKTLQAASNKLTRRREVTEQEEQKEGQGKQKNKKKRKKKKKKKKKRKKKKKKKKKTKKQKR